MHDQWLVTLLTIVAITPVAALGCALLYAVFLSVRRHLENRCQSSRLKERSPQGGAQANPVGKRER